MFTGTFMRVRTHLVFLLLVCVPYPPANPDHLGSVGVYGELPTEPVTPNDSSASRLE